jgi:selenocysteine-specific elongation factor
MPVVGTAGHVDHGKSTLIQALTGRDPDRWEEEKRRGLTIDLGFAWMDLDGVPVGFVDVPGHERFIKNMLAGIEAVQAALFVVAADEGWMPQSEEHLAVLDLLDLDTAVVALTRIDLVDGDTAALAALEIEEALAGTSLEGSQIVGVSAPTGQGIDELRAALASAVGRTAIEDVGRPRLWVDRSFVISGAGTVVTGTLTGGSLAVGDEVVLWPGRHQARVRSLQSHEAARETVGPGTRAAANLVGLEATAVERGAMVGLAGHWEPTDRLLVDLRTVRNLAMPLKDRGAYHLHLGSGAWPARLRIIADGVLQDRGAAILSVAGSIPTAMGDRFVLREVGRRAVVAGGRVLDPKPLHRRAATMGFLADLRAALDGTSAQRAEALLEVRGMAPLAILTAEAAGGIPENAIVAGGVAIARGRAGQLRAEAAAEIADFHSSNPLRAGMPKASIAERLGIGIAQLEVLIAADPGLVDEGSTVRDSGFAGGWGDAQESVWQEAQKRLTKEGLAVPRARDLELNTETLHALERDGRLVRIDEDLVYLPEQVEAIRESLVSLPNAFTVAEFRDALGVTRRHAVPLLEWLDRTGMTTREGDVRSVRPRRGETDADDAPPR